MEEPRQQPLPPPIMSPAASSSNGKESGTARVLGSGASGSFAFLSDYLPFNLHRMYVGVAELLIFHPVDTVAKRLMSNKTKVLPISSCLALDFQT